MLQSCFSHVSSWTSGRRISLLHSGDTCVCLTWIFNAPFTCPFYMHYIPQYRDKRIMLHFYMYIHMLMHAMVSANQHMSWWCIGKWMQCQKPYLHPTGLKEPRWPWSQAIMKIWENNRGGDFPWEKKLVIYNWEAVLQNNSHFFAI